MEGHQSSILRQINVTANSEGTLCRIGEAKSKKGLLRLQTNPYSAWLLNQYPRWRYILKNG